MWRLPVIQLQLRERAKPRQFQRLLLDATDGMTPAPPGRVPPANCAPPSTLASRLVAGVVCAEPVERPFAQFQRVAPTESVRETLPPSEDGYSVLRCVQSCIDETPAPAGDG